MRFVSAFLFLFVELLAVVALLRIAALLLGFLAFGRRGGGRRGRSHPCRRGSIRLRGGLGLRESCRLRRLGLRRRGLSSQLRLELCDPLAVLLSQPLDLLKLRGLSCLLALVALELAAPCLFLVPHCLELRLDLGPVLAAQLFDQLLVVGLDLPLLGLVLLLQSSQLSFLAGTPLGLSRLVSLELTDLAIPLLQGALHVGDPRLEIQLQV